MKKYPEELEKDMVKALGKLIGYHCIHMPCDIFPHFLDDLSDFCKKYDMSDIFDMSADISLSSMLAAMREVLK